MRLFAIPLVVTLLVSTASRAETLTHSVDARDGRRCNAILRVPEGEAKLPLLLVMHGSGVYSNVDDGAVAYFGHFLTRGEAAVLMFDKPGIGFEGGEVRVDEAVYRRFTIDDLVACAEAALGWASAERKGRLDGRIVIAGHSEGAIVAVRLLRKLSKARAPLLSSIELVSMSGLPLESWDKILSGQYPAAKWARLKKAIDAGDDAAVWELASLGAAYFREKTPATGVLLRELAEEGLGTPIEVFQGLDDRNVSTAAVRELERWNAARAARKEAALRLDARYYEAGHGLNRAAVHDILRVVDRALRP